MILKYIFLFYSQLTQMMGNFYFISEQKKLIGKDKKDLS